MLDSLITCLLCGRKAFTYLEYEDIRDVVLAVGSCAGFWDVCVLRLSWHVHKFASSLRSVARGDDDLAGKVGGYDKICYVLLALEQMLVEASGQEMPCLETVDSIQSDLNGALLQISQAFPVVGISVSETVLDTNLRLDGTPEHQKTQIAVCPKAREREYLVGHQALCLRLYLALPQ
ncbi:PREDICTED: uncharacterized protein LOC107338858 [Acropora digitifera]|uniref:uncharacterized protein LOC107338858 n=1 Tax=Acropora digitifera TaxID=70779 RepID=UPI00077A7AC2|nr:PREDICTED: uncharacterized protein LOC107338858 [Acropora digitifera]